MAAIGAITVTNRYNQNFSPWWPWWYTPVILALGRLKQEDSKFKVSLSNIVRLCPKKKSKYSPLYVLALRHCCEFIEDLLLEVTEWASGEDNTIERNSVPHVSQEKGMPCHTCPHWKCQGWLRGKGVREACGLELFCGSMRINGWGMVSRLSSSGLDTLNNFSGLRDTEMASKFQYQGCFKAGEILAWSESWIKEVVRVLAVDLFVCIWKGMLTDKSFTISRIT
jgi:hypothetical protein